MRVLVKTELSNMIEKEYRDIEFMNPYTYENFLFLEKIKLLDGITDSLSKCDVPEIEINTFKDTYLITAEKTLNDKERITFYYLILTNGLTDCRIRYYWIPKDSFHETERKKTVKMRVYRSHKSLIKYLDVFLKTYCL